MSGAGGAFRALGSLSGGNDDGARLVLLRGLVGVKKNAPNHGKDTQHCEGDQRYAPGRTPGRIQASVGVTKRV